jgi:hypothetical protein
MTKQLTRHSIITAKEIPFCQRSAASWRNQRFRIFTLKVLRRQLHRAAPHQNRAPEFKHSRPELGGVCIGFLARTES